ncbi:P-loop containing nucleoside triphosphate hydrolase protein [Aspergillus heterothallicus]
MNQSLEDFRRELETLLRDHPNERSTKAILLLYPTLEHYGTFAENFVNMMANPVETSMMWGLLCLIFKGARFLGESTHGNALARITKWLDKIGHYLRASNDCKDSITDLGKVKGDTVTVNTEIESARQAGMMLTVAASLDESAWETLTAVYNNSYKTIEEATKRIERVAEMTEKQARAMENMIFYQRIMNLEESRQFGASLPCNTLPVAQNHRFFGRRDILDAIEKHLTPTDTQSHLTSIALYGLGGIGKTPTALAYAYQRLDDLDAVFWIASEDPFSIQQGFSRIALDALRLKKAHPQAYQENMVLALNWLQKTHAKWLLIFDNVDSHDVLDNCWPASKHGAVLVTTRDVLVASLPIDRGIEVTEFDATEEAEFLLDMSTNRRRVDGEVEEAQKVANLLGGLPRALNQMAALISARNWSIRDFYNMYRKHEQHLHKQKKGGWKYLGYQHALDTVWEIAFTTLGDEARACLGVLSLLSADSIPSEVFTPAEYGDLPELLAFCENELSLDDALEELTHHALIRRNIEEGSFRIHRLVQAECRARMKNPQEEFEAATKLLLSKFPSERSNKYDNEEWILYERYIPQVLYLARNYVEACLPQAL